MGFTRFLLDLQSHADKYQMNTRLNMHPGVLGLQFIDANRLSFVQESSWMDFLQLYRQGLLRKAQCTLVDIEAICAWRRFIIAFMPFKTCGDTFMMNTSAAFELFFWYWLIWGGYEHPPIALKSIVAN